MFRSLHCLPPACCGLTGLTGKQLSTNTWNAYFLRGLCRGSDEPENGLSKTVNKVQSTDKLVRAKKVVMIISTSSLL